MRPASRTMLQATGWAVVSGLTPAAGWILRTVILNLRRLDGLEPGPHLEGALAWRRDR